MPLLRQKTADSSLSPVMPNMMPILLHLSIIVIWKKVLQALIFQSTIFQMMIRQRHQLSHGALQDSSYILIGQTSMFAKHSLRYQRHQIKNTGTDICLVPVLFYLITLLFAAFFSNACVQSEKIKNSKNTMLLQLQVSG